MGSSLSIFIKSAILDGLNPLVVLLFFAILLLGASAFGGRVLFVVSLYCLGIFLVFLLAGIEEVQAIFALPRLVSEYLLLTLGTLVVAGGLREIMYCFWPHAPEVNSAESKEHGESLLWGGLCALLTGIFVASVTMPYTGALYLTIITKATVDLTPHIVAELVIYSLAVVSPLIIVLLILAIGRRLRFARVTGYFRIPFTRLTVGLLLILLGWLFMLVANGSINFG